VLLAPDGQRRTRVREQNLKILIDLRDKVGADMVPLARIEQIHSVVYFRPLGDRSRRATSAAGRAASDMDCAARTTVSFFACAFLQRADAARARFADKDTERERAETHLGLDQS
jgi:hypothetical protein